MIVRLEVIADHLQQQFNLHITVLAVHTENDCTFTIKDPNVTAFGSQAPFLDQYFFIVTDVRWCADSPPACSRV